MIITKVKLTFYQHTVPSRTKDNLYLNFLQIRASYGTQGKCYVGLFNFTFHLMRVSFAFTSYYAVT